MMKIAVAITGASGAIYPKVLLDKLTTVKEQFAAIDLVWSGNAPMVWELELGDKSFANYPFATWQTTNFLAPFASGSAGYDALIICPCSMGTIGRIAGGISNDLITRAADVMLKERKKLICVVRETPYNLVHLRNMTTITEAGGIICPATPSFYSKPQTIEEVAATVVDRALQLAGVDIKTFRWGKD
ncbi:MAG: UbiX family flavin prenyltransferase [Chitinophagaceae bacterium]|nr:UbiX family flavin prenyltransferase [Chitinophagaceae bacterium]